MLPQTAFTRMLTPPGPAAIMPALGLKGSAMRTCKKPAGRRRRLKQLAIAVAAAPLLQGACTGSALVGSFTREVNNSATLYAFEAAQTIFFNLFRL
jgi:hypothetical protein